MLSTPILGLVVLGYFMGAIPFGLLIARLKGIDIRSRGSGNIGATNVFRVMGWKFGAPVFFLDALKSYIPTLFALNMSDQPWVHIGVGGAAVLGHTFTVFGNFKGGKGAASGLGVLLALSPDVFGIVAVSAAGTIWAFRIVSLGTLVGCILTPLLLWILNYPLVYVCTMLLLAALVVFRHKGNILRLLKGTENTFR